MSNKQNLQDSFLNALCQTQCVVSMYLVNGIRLVGAIQGFDNFVMMLLSTQSQMMVYKHAISTIVPMRPIALQRPVNVTDEGELRP